MIIYATLTLLFSILNSDSFLQYRGQPLNLKRVRPSWTSVCRVSCLWASEKFAIDYNVNNYCSHSSPFIIDRHFLFLQGAITYIKAWMMLNYGKFPLQTTLIATLKRLKMCDIKHTQVPSFFIWAPLIL